MIPKIFLIRLFQQLFQFLITIGFAKIWGTQGNGEFSLFFTDVSFFILLVGLSAESGIVYFVAKKKINLSQLSSFIGALIIFQILILVLVYWLSAFFFNYYFFQFGRQLSALFWGILYIVSSNLINYSNAYLAAKNIYFKNILASVFVQAIFLIGVFYLYFSNKNLHPMWVTTNRLIPAYTLLMTVQAIINIAFVFKLDTEKLTIDFTITKLQKAFLSFIAIICIGNLVQFLAYRMDIWILNYYVSKSEVGVYAFSSKMAQVFWLIPQLLSSLIFPMTALKHQEVSSQKFNSIFKWLMIITLLGVIISIFLFPILIHYVVGDAYEKSYPLFLYQLPGVVIFSINILLAARLSGHGIVKINMQGSILCFMVLIILDLWMIPKMGPKGAAIANSFGYAISTFYLIFKFNRWSKNK